MFLLVSVSTKKSSTNFVCVSVDSFKRSAVSSTILKCIMIRDAASLASLLSVSELRMSRILSIASKPEFCLNTSVTHSFGDTANNTDNLPGRVNRREKRESEQLRSAHERNSPLFVGLSLRTVAMAESPESWTIDC